MSAGKKESFLTNWMEVGGPGSGIYRDNATGREGEVGTVTLDPIYSPSDELHIYNYRKDTTVPFVNAYGAEVITPNQPPPSDKSKAKDPLTHMVVATERIPHRLVNCPQLTYPETLYTLDRSLEGYDVAYQRCGPMRVNDRMIGFNNQGECKVWVNENFANNHPSYPRGNLVSTRSDSHDFLAGKYSNIVPIGGDEGTMVQDVVNTVEDYCEEGRFPEPFASRIHQPNLSFNDARRIIGDTIAEGRIPVANRVDLFNNKVWRRTTTTTTTHGGANTVTNINTANVGAANVTTTNVTNTVLPASQTYVTTTPASQTYVTTTRAVEPVRGGGYMFNYLPASRTFEPDIFASRVGEHGVHKGNYY
jgi:hypothetical protein